MTELRRYNLLGSTSPVKRYRWRWTARFAAWRRNAILLDSMYYVAPLDTSD